MAKARRPGAGCIGLASEDGLAVALETAPKSLDILLCGGHALCHTNHWLSPLMLAGDEATRYSYTSTYMRLDRIRRLTGPLEGQLGPKELCKVKKK